MQDWDYYHALPFLGYSIERFQEVLEVAERTFDDEVTSCHECGEYMWNDNGRTYNYRIVDECTLLGMECGCYDEWCKKNWKSKINTPDECVELDFAEELESKGKLVHIARYIGGMTDGRGGYYAGECCAEGEPKKVLAALLKKNPKAKYVFTHDESGQFQTYFSVWRVKQRA
jgi:hypothetical protein